MGLAYRCAAIVAIALACGSVQAADIVTIRITDLAFTPSQVSAKVGDIVEWVNDDFIDHTATSNAGDWDIMVPAGKSARLPLTKAGEFGYFCRVHPDMTGAVTVPPN